LDLEGKKLKWIGVSSKCSLNRFGKEHIDKNWGRGCIAGYSWVFSNKHGDCRTTIYGTLMGFWVRNRDNKVSLQYLVSVPKTTDSPLGIVIPNGSRKTHMLESLGKLPKQKLKTVRKTEASNLRVSCVLS
jgi:hypothetical protein